MMVVTDRLTLANPYSKDDQTNHVPVVREVIEEPFPALVIDFVSAKEIIRRTISLHSVVWNTLDKIPLPMFLYRTCNKRVYTDFIVMQLYEPYRSKIAAYVDNQINKEDKRNEVL